MEMDSAWLIAKRLDDSKWIFNEIKSIGDATDL